MVVDKSPLSGLEYWQLQDLHSTPFVILMPNSQKWKTCALLIMIDMTRGVSNQNVAFLDSKVQK